MVAYLAWMRQNEFLPKKGDDHKVEPNKPWKTQIGASLLHKCSEWWWDQPLQKILPSIYLWPIWLLFFLRPLRTSSWDSKTTKHSPEGRPPGRWTNLTPSAPPSITDSGKKDSSNGGYFTGQLKKHKFLLVSNQKTDGFRSSPRDLVMRINALPKGTRASPIFRTRVTGLRDHCSTDWAIAPPLVVGFTR